MSLHRRDAKRDANERLIVEVLQKRGFHVDRVSAPGFPDLVVSKRGWLISGMPQVWFVEVKRPKGRYTAKQIEWLAKWQGPTPYRLESVEDALAFPDYLVNPATRARAHGKPQSSPTRRRRA